MISGNFKYVIALRHLQNKLVTKLHIGILCSCYTEATNIYMKRSELMWL